VVKEFHGDEGRRLALHLPAVYGPAAEPSSYGCGPKNCLPCGGEQSREINTHRNKCLGRTI